MDTQIKKTMNILNFTVFLQQQRYITAITFLFYLSCGLSFSDFIFFQSIFYFTLLLAEIPAGYIGDILPRKYILIFSYLLFAFRLVLWIFFRNYYTILIGEILYGLSKAFYRGTSDGYMYDYLKEHNSSNLIVNKYGTFNFFMSLSSGISCLIGAWLYTHHSDFSILLSIELVMNLTAVILLCTLPNIKQQNTKNKTLSNHLNMLWNTVKSTVRNSDINYYILYAGILFGTTSIFVWNFQPFMKNFELAAYIFGIIYFINHLFRALGSLFADKFKLSLPKTGILSSVLYTLSFLMMIYLCHTEKSSICIMVLIFVCVAIGIQMIYNVRNLSRIHSLTSSDIRVTVSSCNSAFTSFCSGLFLMCFKFLLDYYSLDVVLTIFMLLFLFTFLLPKRMKQ